MFLEGGDVRSKMIPCEAASYEGGVGSGVGDHGVGQRTRVAVCFRIRGTLCGELVVNMLTRKTLRLYVGHGPLWLVL